MKYLITLITLLLSFGIQAQNRVEIKTPIFEVVYDTVYQQPVILTYEVFCSPDAPSYPRGGMDFKTVPGTKTSSATDYAGNVWDKGHLAPANTFACSKEWLIMTFSYLNCALQHEGLNRGPWARLEAFERDLRGLYDEVNVHIEIYFSDEWTDNSDPARIPSSFVKTITWIEDNGKEKSISFDFPNKNPKGKSFWYFQIK